MIQRMLEQLHCPDKEYTPIPFWFLNDELTDREMVRQLQEFHEKGVDGVVLHPRIGIPESIPYLSEKYFHFIRLAVETAEKLGMVIVLYDEGMYPSGSAHGQVVAENPRFASQAIFLTEDPAQGKVIVRCPDGKYIVQANSGGTIRGVHFGEDDGEKNAPPSADLLSQEAVDTFLRLTHQRYYEEVGEYFGSTILGFFTDEPSALGRCCKPNCFAWTWDFEQEFVAQGGRMEELEGLFTGEENDSTRLYRKMIFQRELDVYYESLHRFCVEHGIALMGHPHAGDDIECEKYFDVPGQDIVLRWVAPEGDYLEGRETAQGKCSSDAARNHGKRRNSNECFGVCVRENIPWYFTGADMKWYLDHLAVRGVNLFIPHAFYYSVAGQRKDERPPDVGPNNIWWEHYRTVSDYIKRISFLMTDSVNEARVCVLCENRSLRMKEVREFYQNQVEFNYLPYVDFREEMVQKGRLTVRENVYEYVACDDQDRVQGVPKICGVTDLPYRDLETQTPCPDLRVSRLKKDGVRMIFLTNEGDDAIETQVLIEGETDLVAMDLWSGECWKVPVRTGQGKTGFDLQLGFRESLLLLLDEKGEVDLPMKKERQYLPVEFALVDEDKKNFVKTYRGMVSLETVEPELWISVQGEEMVECWVNGEFVGFHLWNPHAFALSKALRPGENEILLKVTGNAANRFTDHRIEYGLL